MGLMGATLGFLRYNIPPAKVFMGDTGSLFLGFNIAVMSIATSHKSGTMLSVVIPVMFVSLPLFDTFLAIIRRALKGQNLMAADKDHLHHRLLSLEFSSVQTLMIFYTLSILLITVSLLSFQRQFVWGATIILLLLYAFFLTLKLFHLFDAGTKIRSINERMREAALRISKYNSEQYIQTKSLDLIVAITTSIMIFKFILSHMLLNYSQLAISVLFCLAVLTVLTYKRVSHIKNQFVSFGFFWFFFYMAYISFKSGFSTFDAVTITILGICIVIKTLIQKQVDLFISNPMELLMCFCMMLIYLFSGTNALDFFYISMSSFIIYYANKFFFTYKCKLNYTYTAALTVFILMFTFNSSLNIIDTGVANNLISMTPAHVKTQLKNYNRKQEYQKGRDLLLSYETKQPLKLMKAYYQSEGAKTYTNLIADSLLSGDLRMSNVYLSEFLNMFPDLVEDFYHTVEPILSKIAKINISGAKNVKIAGYDVYQISNAYASTLYTISSKYARKGYDVKSDSYTEVALLLEDFSKSKK